MIERDGVPIFEEYGRTLREQRVHRFCPDDVVHQPVRAAISPEVPRDVSLQGMLEARTLGEKVAALVGLLERSGLFRPHQRSASLLDEAVEAVAETEDRAFAARRLVGVLRERGDVHGPAMAAAVGLMSAHEHDLDMLRSEITRLAKREAIVLHPGAEPEGLLPLFVWAVGQLRRGRGDARSALAAALIEHPTVEDLFCADEELLDRPALTRSAIGP